MVCSNKQKELPYSKRVVLPRFCPQKKKLIIQFILKYFNWSDTKNSQFYNFCLISCGVKFSSLRVKGMSIKETGRNSEIWVLDENIPQNVFVKTKEGIKKEMMMKDKNLPIVRLFYYCQYRYYPIEDQVQQLLWKAAFEGNIVIQDASDHQPAAHQGNGGRPAGSPAMAAVMRPMISIPEVN